MPNAKKQRANKKKTAAAAAAPKRPPAITAAASRIEAANTTVDLSSGLEAFLSIDLSAAAPAAAPTAAPAAAPAATTAAADPVRLDIRSPKTLNQGDAQGMYDLLKANMHDMYVDAGWGWDKAEKWREMEHRDARFLIARCGGGGDSGGGAAAAEQENEEEEEEEQASGGEAETAVSAVVEGVGGVRIRQEEGLDRTAANGEVRDEKTRVSCGAAPGGAASDAQKRETAGGERVAGYCHFRFAWDQDENEDGEGVGGTEDVLYVYELQVAPWAKRRGLGRRMMQALELLANRHGMTKVMLTVFKENRQAMSFYTKKMKYGVDKDSPSNWDQPDEVYEILSKPTRQGAARIKEARRKATLLD